MSIEHTYRWATGTDDEVGVRTEMLTPIRAIRRHCYECMGFCENVHLEVQECLSPTCALYPFRLGNAHSGKGGGHKSDTEPSVYLWSVKITDIKKNG